MFMYATNPRSLKVHAVPLHEPRYTCCGLPTWRDLVLAAYDPGFTVDYVDCGNCKRVVKARTKM
jgi:hypothetical protein